MSNVNQFILTTSGFILPASPYFTVLSTDKITDNSILNRNLVTTTDNNISEFIKSNTIYHSEVANEAYKKYLNDQSFESFIHLVDITIEVLSQVNFNTFFEIQANNRNLSPIAFMFCLDVISGHLPKKYNQYSTIPLSVRFTSSTHVTNENISKNKSLLKENLRTSQWPSFISELTEHREAFSTFFKFIFTDAYQ